MIISNSKNFVFFHVPKSGGTSISALLDSELEWTDIAIGGTPLGEAFQQTWSLRFGIYKHTTPRILCALIGDERYRTYRKFIVVRDPLARARSAYGYFSFLIKSNSSWFVSSEEYSQMDGLESFENFVNGTYFSRALEANPDRATDFQKCILPQAIYYDKRSADDDNFIWFRLEDLISSALPLVNLRILRTLKALPKENSSASKGAFVSDETRRYLQSAYRADYELFGYTQS
jgi:hypothetical protein